MTPFIPARADIHEVRTILASHNLPNELILSILDYARYWCQRSHAVEEHRVLMDEDFDPLYSAAYPYLGFEVFSPSQYVGQEIPKIREIEFLVVSHGTSCGFSCHMNDAHANRSAVSDQGWTTEDTAGTYKTSSWFEVSILRRNCAINYRNSPSFVAAIFHGYRDVHPSIYDAKCIFFPSEDLRLIPRPNCSVEPQRQHCSETMNVAHRGSERKDSGSPFVGKSQKGDHAWYLQGNEVARATSVFDGEMVKRYQVVWSSTATPRWVGNEGTGRGTGFVDSLQQGDWLCVWARAKVSSNKSGT